MNRALSKLPELLLPWYAAGHRALPWRLDREPYHVWLSEIMLQQTRAEAVKGYYSAFLAALPDIPSLAAAPAEQCRKLWEGLGYYSRVQNLQRAAVQIMEIHGGKFPRTYEEILALPGIGEYTAGAIGSICFDLPTPAVDGNVLRVFARLLADPRPLRDPGLKREASLMLEKIYPRQAPGDFTQALMELGATVCRPAGAPDCTVCPLGGLCKAHKAGEPERFPIRAQKKPRRVEELTVLYLLCGDRVAVEKRQETGLLAGLWQYPNVPGKRSPREALELAEQWGVHPAALVKSVRRKHLFTHVEWQMNAVYILCNTPAPQFSWITEKQRAREYALPTAFRMFSEPMN